MILLSIVVYLAGSLASLYAISPVHHNSDDQIEDVAWAFWCWPVLLIIALFLLPGYIHRRITRGF